MKELEKLSDEALDHRLHYVRGLCPEGIAVIVPRYTADLNECAKVESGLTDEQWHIYCVILLEREWPQGWQSWRETKALMELTARQRTIALIATLEAK